MQINKIWLVVYYSSSSGTASNNAPTGTLRTLANVNISESFNIRLPVSTLLIAVRSISNPATCRRAASKSWDIFSLFLMYLPVLMMRICLQHIFFSY